MKGRVHLCPPAGSDAMPCCDRTPATIRTSDSVTIQAHEVTCTDRAVAELVVDTDGGESPFGWRETPPDTRTPLPHPGGL